MNDNSLKILCTALASVLVTVLFMWLTWPKNVATASQVTDLGATIQRQIDQQQSQLDDMKAKEAARDVWQARVEARLGIHD